MPYHKIRAMVNKFNFTWGNTIICVVFNECTLYILFEFYSCSKLNLFPTLILMSVKQMSTRVA